jgi:hypothetical protein
VSALGRRALVGLQLQPVGDMDAADDEDATLLLDLAGRLG